MQQYLINILICVIYELIAFSLVYTFSQSERDNIIEVGYRSQSKKHKKLNKDLPLWDNILHWSLCKEAKIKTNAVWVYFSCNLYLVISVFISVIYACILVMLCDHKALLLNLLKYFMFIFLTWICAHLVFDLIYLPSEQKRYGKRTGEKK